MTFDELLANSRHASTNWWKTREDVKVYEPCVILSKNESYTFRFVFLTSERIWITDNPPNSILYSVHLSAIKDAQLILDKAVFLQKELQETTQHNLIRHVSEKQDTLTSELDHSPAGSSTKVESSVERRALPTSGSATMIKSFKNLFAKKNTLSVRSDNSSSVLSEQGNTSHSPPQNVRSSFSNGDYADPSTALEPGRTNLSQHSGMESASSGTASEPRAKRLKWNEATLRKCDILEPFAPFPQAARTRDMHLYILNQNSIFYPLLKSAWRSHLLKSTTTLCRDEPRAGKPADSKTLKLLFSELKEDILFCLQKQSPVEVVYRYLHELKSAAEEHVYLRSLFWQDGELISGCKELLARFLSQESSSEDDRVDELDCCALLAETMAFMFEHAEASAACQMILQKQSSSFYASLFDALLHPSLRSIPKHKSELRGIGREFARAATEIVYYLIIIARQAHWNCSSVSHPALTSRSLFAIIGSRRGLTWLLDEIVSDSVDVWSVAHKSPSDSQHVDSDTSLTSALSTPEEAMTPAECVGLYKRFVVIHRCMSECAIAREHSTASYREEFKYYIRPDSLEAKIPEAYPACSIIRNAVQAVACLVLGSTNQ